MLAPTLFLWIVATAGYLWWDPVVGFYALLAGPLILSLVLWPAWLGALWTSLGLRTPQWLARLRLVPRAVARILAWLWAVGWTFAMPNPIALLVATIVPEARGLLWGSVFGEFTRWAMDHPRYAFPLFFVTGWCVAALWALRSNGQGTRRLVRD